MATVKLGSNYQSCRKMICISYWVSLLMCYKTSLAAPQLWNTQLTLGQQCLAPYRVPNTYRDMVVSELKDMFKNGFTEPSASQWSAPMMLVQKKDGSLRLCMCGHCRLNSVSKIEAYPMPLVDELLDHFGKAHFISTMDITWGYWQVPVAVKDRYNTALSSPFG